MKRTIVLGLLLTLLCARAVAAPRVTIDAHDASLTDVLTLLAAQSGRNIVADDSVRPERITLHLRNVTFEDALTVIVRAHALAVHMDRGVLIVGTSASMNRRYGSATASQDAVTLVLRMAHADAAQAAKQLLAALPEGSVVLADPRTSSVIVTADRDAIGRARLLLRALDRSDPPAVSSDLAHVYALRFIKPGDVLADLKGTLPDGSYVADDAQNAVIVTGGDRIQRLAQAFVQSMDVPTAQVEFEVRVADIMPESSNSNVGIEFGGYDLAGQPTSGSAAYTFASKSLAINARLNALISRGRAQILATPKLVTLNNKEADLLIGETYPVAYYDSRLGGQQVQFVDVGVKLRLTPTIGADGSVTAEMHPEYSAIQTFVGGYPVIANRKIDSTLRVRDNETIVLGGLLREIDSQTVTKVPWLADIPVFGKLFQNRQSEHERDEVVFFITPHILHVK
jgi:type II secretory pathway component GspD/PulD (secretin)